MKQGYLELLVFSLVFLLIPAVLLYVSIVTKFYLGIFTASGLLIVLSYAVYKTIKD